jgi:hypothetical protein
MGRLRGIAALGMVVLVCVAGASAQEAHKYAMTMFHCNVQYVAGGTIGFLPVSIPGWEQTQQENEDMIIREGFKPVVDFYLAHPDWGVNIELQGYYIDVLAARHPDVLDGLRTLVQRGQAELVSFHYSDQFYLAYPREDWERSVDLTEAVFAANGLTMGKAVFAQEGQSGVGMAPRMAERGYETIVWPTNLFKWQYGEDYEPEPYYAFGDGTMVLGAKSFSKPTDIGEVNVQWTFFDDGELLATGEWDPYFPTVFKYRPEAMEQYEAEVQALVDQGYRPVTVSQYVADLKEKGLAPAPTPKLLDGTWQPQSTDGMFRWLGGRGLWAKTERDNHVRTLCATAHRELVAAGTALDALAASDPDEGVLRGAIDSAWRLLFLGEVTDASGINPYRGEIGYGLGHCGEALRVARDAVGIAGSKLGLPEFTIDTKAGTVGPAAPPTAATDEPPVLALEIEARGRRVTETWTKISDAPEVHRVEVNFGPGRKTSNTFLRVRFPGTTTKIVFCPGLDDLSPIEVDRGDFVWDHFTMALGNGMIGLGDDLYVIKDQGFTHIGANIYPEDLAVEFMDDTAPWMEAIPWVFHVVRGTVQEAVDVADRLNVHPTVTRGAWGGQG